MKIKPGVLAVSIAIPLAAGAIAGLASAGSMDALEALTKPPLSPPGWLFPVVWSILYVMMGIASYLVFTSGADRKSIKTALTVYGVQLFFNFAWTFLFFNFELYGLAFVWLLVLWILITFNIALFSQINKTAAYLMVPYLIWVTFAAYLNLAIALLN